MKSLYSTFAILGIIFSALFVSCGDDNDKPFDNSSSEYDETTNNDKSNNLNSSFFVGTWHHAEDLVNYNTLYSQGYDAEDYIAKSEKIVFYSNGTGNYKWNQTYSSGNSNFTWKIKGDKIELLWNGEQMSKCYDVLIFTGYMNSKQVVFMYEDGSSVHRFADSSTAWQKRY